MKTCSICLTEKSTEDFYKERNKCKECQTAYIREWQRNNTDARTKHQATWRKNHPEAQQRLNRLNLQRRRVALGDDHLPNDVWERLIAAYGEQCMKPTCTRTERLTLDHVIPLAVGGTHTLDNVQILCHWCNAGKRDRLGDYRPFVLK